MAFLQSTDYKKSPAEVVSNYYKIVTQKRAVFDTLKASRTLIKSKNKTLKHFERWAYYWKDRVDTNGCFSNDLQCFYKAVILNADGKINTNQLSNSTSKIAHSTEV